jgi:transposase
MNEHKPKQRQIRKKYSPQFKDEVLARAERDGVARAAKDLGLPEPLIYSWRAKKKLCGQPIENQKLQQAELAALRRKNAQLEEENAFLKKAAAYFAKDEK